MTYSAAIPTGAAVILQDDPDFEVGTVTEWHGRTVDVLWDDCDAPMSHPTRSLVVIGQREDSR